MKAHSLRKWPLSLRMLAAVVAPGSDLASAQDERRKDGISGDAQVARPDPEADAVLRDLACMVALQLKVRGPSQDWLARPGGRPGGPVVAGLRGRSLSQTLALRHSCTLRQAHSLEEVSIALSFDRPTLSLLIRQAHTHR